MLNQIVVEERLRDFVIGVSDTLPAHKMEMTICNTYKSQFESTTLEMKCGKTGKHFIIQLQQKGILSVTEVEVYAEGTVSVSFSFHALIRQQREWVKMCFIISENMLFLKL